MRLRNVLFSCLDGTVNVFLECFGVNFLDNTVNALPECSI